MSRRTLIKNLTHALHGLLLKLNYSGGERGIRTPGGVTLNGFQDRRNRPLCHLSRVAYSFKGIKPLFKHCKFKEISLMCKEVNQKVENGYEN